MSVNGMTPAQLRALADEIESRECTGVAAQWCPTHGTCVCDADDDDPYEPRGRLNAECPLHSPLSSHP